MSETDPISGISLGVKGRYFPPLVSVGFSSTGN